jgi:hypothetical protein
VVDAVRLTVDFLDGTDDNARQLVAALQYGLSAAAEAELVSPDFETDLRGWMHAEMARLRPQYIERPQRDHLRESRWFGFWSSLEPGQEVRWTQTKASTYFVVTGELVEEHPDSRYRASAGPFVELRRHTGRTFWSHVAQVRPLGWVGGSP